MNTVKHTDFRSVDPQYNQDLINGITHSEYDVLLEYLKEYKKVIKTVLDSAGGSGRLTKLLIENSFDAYLSDIADNMIEEAIRNGVPQERTMVADLLIPDFTRKFDCVILKSAMHEFSKDKVGIIHSTMYKLLNSDGLFIDWDVHQPNQECAEWVKKWVNLKDTIAGLDSLVENRMFYTEKEIEDGLLLAGFKDFCVFHRFYYTPSVKKFSHFYWSDDEAKTNLFYDETEKLARNKPDGIIIERVDNDIIVKIPAVILSVGK